MKKKKLVSILILNYNNHEYVINAIDSCLKQTYKNIEILVYDDKSSDESKSKIIKFNRNKKFKFFFNKNTKKNIASFDAFNGYLSIFKKSRGEIVCLLDSDDEFQKNKVKKIAKYFEKKKNISFIQNLYLKDNLNIKKKNSFLSFWPYLAPESCISFRRNLMIEFLKKNRKLKYKFPHIWLGFRLGLFSYFNKKNFFTLEEGLTLYSRQGESKKYKTFNKNWFLRRNESFKYLNIISSNSVIYKLNIDYFITRIICFFYKYI